MFCDSVCVCVVCVRAQNTIYDSLMAGESAYLSELSSVFFFGPVGGHARDARGRINNCDNSESVV